MASQRVREPNLSDPGAYALAHMLHLSDSSFINQEGSAFDFGELEDAILQQGVKIHNDETKQQLSYNTDRPAATLEMFPSWPMRFQQKTPGGSSKSGEVSTVSGSAVNTLSSSRLGPESPTSRKVASEHHLQQPQPPPQMETARGSDSPRAGVSQAAKQTPEKKRRRAASNSEKMHDAKTLRRLAQNREAARKSRLRRKAYVQQLESSRIRLTQLEHDLHRAKSHGLFLGGGGVASGNVSHGSAVFDTDYARWLDDDHGHMSELRTALQAHLSDGDLRLIVDGYIAHYDEIFRLKQDAVKSDVFHLITGMWATPAERCFLWIGGFRPSDLIKMLIAQLDPLTEQQFVGIYGLQQSLQQAEEALSKGLEQLQQSVLETMANGTINDSMHNMAVALDKLTNLEGFVHQADNLRQQTLHQLCQCLTVRQAAQYFLFIGEYYSRLRALSSTWLSCPRDNLMADDTSCQTTTDLQMVQSSQNQFSNF